MGFNSAFKALKVNGVWDLINIQKNRIENERSGRDINRDLLLTRREFRYFTREMQSWC
jgi:hypothetical protein